MKKRYWIPLSTILLIVVTAILAFISLPKYIERGISNSLNSLTPNANISISFDNFKFNILKGVSFADVKLKSIGSDDTITIKSNRLSIRFPFLSLWRKENLMLIRGIDIDSINIYTSKSLDNLLAKTDNNNLSDIVSLFNNRIQLGRIFRFQLHHFIVIDNEDKTIVLSDISIKKELYGGLKISINNGSVKSIGSIKNLQLSVRNGDLLDGSNIAKKTFIHKRRERSKLLIVRDSVNGYLLNLDNYLGNYISYDSLSLKIDKIISNNTDFKSLENLYFKSKCGDILRRYRTSCTNFITASKPTLQNFDITWKVGENGVIIEHIDLKSNILDFIASGDIALIDNYNSSCNLSFNGLNITKLNKKYSGMINSEVVFSGEIEDFDSWNLKGSGAILSLKLPQKLFSYSTITPYNNYSKILVNRFNLDEKAVIFNGYITDNIGEKEDTLDFTINRIEKKIDIGRFTKLPIFINSKRFEISNHNSITLDFKNSKDFSLKNLEVITIDSLKLFTNKESLGSLIKLRKSKNDIKIMIPDSLTWNSILIIDNENNDSIIELGNGSFDTKNNNFRVNTSSFKSRSKSAIGINISGKLDKEIKISNLDISKSSVTLIKESNNKRESDDKSYKIARNFIDYSNRYLTDIAKIRVNRIFIESDTVLGYGKSLLIKRNRLKNSIGYKITMKKLSYKGVPNLDNSLGYFETLGNKKLKIIKFTSSFGKSKVSSRGKIILTENYPCSLNIRVDNIKVSEVIKNSFSKQDGDITGDFFSSVTITGKTLKPLSWQGKGFVKIKNLNIKNTALQKGEMITKFAPPFKNIYFSNINMNPIVVKRGGKYNINSIDALGPFLSFNGMGNIDSKGNFYFDIDGEISDSIFKMLPSLTRSALYEGDTLNERSFAAKVFGTPKKQELVPQRGIYSTIIRSKFRMIGKTFKKMFN